MYIRGGEICKFNYVYTQSFARHEHLVKDKIDNVKR